MARRCIVCDGKLGHVCYWLRPGHKIGLFPSFGPYDRSCADAAVGPAQEVQAATRVNCARLTDG